MSVVRLDVTSRPLAGGRAFGEIGAYEELSGEASFSVDPLAAANAVVTDLELAPRDGDGRVGFSADVRILRPLDGHAGNRGIFLDVVNRGSSIFARMLEPGPMGPGTQLTEGWLLQRGYTVVSCGWQHDVPRGGGWFGLTAPHAVVNGKPLTGRVTTAKQIDQPATLLGPFDGTAPERGYPALDVHEPGATLGVRDDPGGPGEVIPRERWQFVDPHHVSYPAGFALGKTYELTYTAVGAPITGAGFLATRDVLSFLRFASAAAGNPCAAQIEFALAMGGSQTGRFLRQMLYLGLCEDEQGRLVLDGLLAIAAGARLTEANRRFGQPSAQGPMSAVFPFTDAVQTDPLSGQRDGLLRRAREHGNVPRIMHINTSSEYCSSAAITHVSAALSHLSADGTADAELPPEVRVYHCAGTQHAPSPLPLGPSDVPAGQGVYYANTIDYKPFVRAAVDNLYAWVRLRTEPPASCYPRLDDTTLIPRDVVREHLPNLPGPALPAAFAPHLWPAIDTDANEVAGLRLPDVSVPLATYTGWNPRRPDTGGPHLLVRATGSTIPFARTRQERLARRDPRPSIQERYASRDVYLERVRGAALALVEARYLLAADVETLVEASAQRYDDFMRLESPMPNTLTGAGSASSVEQSRKSGEP
jgi:hypothetical protein